MKIEVEINAVFEQLLLQEDTDKDKKMVTSKIIGPKYFFLSRERDVFINFPSPCLVTR